MGAAERKGVAPHNKTNSKMKRRNLIGLLCSVALFTILMMIPTPPQMSDKAWDMVAVTALVAALWITDAIYFGITALLPVVLLPILGITPPADVTKVYANESVFLFMGGFMIALAMERTGLHRRFAIGTIKVMGSGSASRLILGFMVAVYILSMWINNTATVLMMMPMCMAIIAQLHDAAPESKPIDRFCKALLLSIAYSASIGGVATLIGTPPNIIMASILSQTLSTEISFVGWMIYALPISLIMLFVAWLLLTRLLFPMRGLKLPLDSQFVADEAKRLGKMTSGQRRMLVLFASVATLWIVRSVINIPLFHTISDTTIAIAGAVALFVIPAGKKQGMLLDWTTASKLPWGILLLFGGGLALSRGYTDSGLSEWIKTVVSSIKGVNIWIVVGAITALVVFLTEIMSNTATATLIIPLMISVAGVLGFEPLLIVAPVTMAASFAFMLPVSTPPNAIVFSYGNLKVTEMARAGILLNLVAIVVLTAGSLLLLPHIFH